MLLQFSVTNHKSIKNTATISMKASKDKTLQSSLFSPDGKKEIVPVLAIYGANAAGKSNVLHALLTMRDMVCGETAKPLKGERIIQEPFAFTENGNEPTTFEVIYYYEGIKYAYGYTFDTRQIISEYLYHWPNGREALIFSREDKQFEFRENVQEQMTLASRTSDNKLYLVSSNEWNCPQTEKAYLWFQQKLKGLVGMGMAFDVSLEAVKAGGSSKQKLLNEMLFADLGIRDVVISDNKSNPEITTVHQIKNSDGKVSSYTLKIEQESMGTQRFFSRIGLWMESLETGSVLVVDEIESSMHPLLTRHLIEMVQDPEINTKHAQLIFTTHDTGLLDQKLLRRDQIWFAEKDEKTMETEVYALTDFSPRKEENIEKGYLQGRYGAIPFVGGGGDLWEE